MLKNHSTHLADHKTHFIGNIKKKIQTRQQHNITCGQYSIESFFVENFHIKNIKLRLVKIKNRTFFFLSLHKTSQP